MNEVVIIFTFILSFAGIAVALWSIIDTRKKFFKEYVRRKSRD